jgi:exopolysaccharide biosynthesis WecB/TagA/CpsF family protein
VVSAVIDAAQKPGPLAVSATAVHGLMEGVHDPGQAGLLNALDIVAPDGQPVRWALNWLHGISLQNRVYGPKLMLELCAAAQREKVPIYLYGSTRQVLESLLGSLVVRFPGLIIAGYEASRFGAIGIAEQSALAATIRASGARLVFVGLGCPRQEQFIWGMRDQLGIPLVAVGAAFEFNAGLAKEAPSWMQRAGLQWLHRLAGDPKRLWRRYLLLNPEYVVRVLLQRWRRECPCGSPVRFMGGPVPG